jgi:hypothetical protein
MEAPALAAGQSPALHFGGRPLVAHSTKPAAVLSDEFAQDASDSRDWLDCASLAAVHSVWTDTRFPELVRARERSPAHMPQMPLAEDEHPTAACGITLEMTGGQ